MTVQTSEAREIYSGDSRRFCRRRRTVRTLIKMAGDTCKKDLKEIDHENCKEIDIFEASQRG